MPVKKRIIKKTESSLSSTFVTKNHFDRTTKALRQEIATKASQSSLDAFKDEIIRHFDVVAENIHHDLVGLLNDRVSILQDADTKLDQRLTVVERRVGINGTL